MIARLLAIPCGFIATVCLLADANTDSNALAFATCAEDLQLPRDVPPTTAQEMNRPVGVTIVLDSDGRAKSIAVEGASAAAELVKYWMSSSTFAKSCGGRTLVIQFSFVTEGPPIDYPFIWVSFQRPNHFIIHKRERKPTIFRLPSPDARKETNK